MAFYSSGRASVLGGQVRLEIRLSTMEKYLSRTGGRMEVFFPDKSFFVWFVQSVCNHIMA